MTDYLPYVGSEYAVDAPATALHFERWFRNWEAGFEGAPGAPKLDLGALPRIAPGGVIKVRSDAVQTIGSLTSVVFVVGFLQVGTVRLTFEYTGVSGGSVSVRRTRAGGVSVLATFSNSGGFVARSVDCPVQPGDQILVQVVGGPIDSSIRNIRVQNDGANLWPGFGFHVEGNTYA